MNNNAYKSVLKTKNIKCSGCLACQASCPFGAISVELTDEGFLEPNINADLCTNCGLCLEVCPLDKESNQNRIKSFYGWHKSETARYKSSSGGAFAAICDEILSCDGIVFGAAFSDDFKEVIFKDTDSCELEKIQKSKYIVSNPQGVYKKIKAELEKGRKTVFCGTPCQAAGLRRYLKTDHENLIIVDFVCGGMPSLSFWQEHLKALEKKYKSKVQSIDFRSKINGWGKLYFEINFENGKKYMVREYLDSFYNCFMCGHASVRDICLNCEFHSKHFSDITIADFWGYRTANVENTENGLSLVLANSPKGLEFIDQMKNFEKYPLDNKFSDYAVSTLKATDQEIENRNSFFDLAKKKGFEKAADKLFPSSTLSHIYAYIKLKIKSRR